MPDISTISTEELLRISQSATQPQQVTGIQDIPTEQLLALAQGQQPPIDVQRAGQLYQERVGQLFGQLGGKLPTAGPLAEADTTFRITPGVTMPTVRPRQPGEPQRRVAYAELERMGLRPRQIELTLQTQNILGRPKIGGPAGGIVGALATTAIAGRFIPGPIDDAAIMVALIAATGAGVGGVAGQAAQTGIEERRLISKREALGAFATEAGLELTGRVAVRGGKFLLSPFIKRTVPEAASLVDDFAKVGGSFSPTELDKRFHLYVGEQLSRGAFGAKQLWQEIEEREGAAVLAYARNFVESIGKGVARETPEQIGQIFAKGITRPNGRIFNIFDDLIDPLYKQVDEIARGSEFGFRQTRIGGRAIRGVTGRFVPARGLQRLQLAPKVSTQSLKRFAKKHLATDSRLNKQFLTPAGRNKFTKVAGMPEKLSFGDMRTLRSAYLKDVRKLARDADQAEGLIKQLAQITDEAIFDPKAAQGLNPRALNLLRNTNALYKAGKKGIETTFSEGLAERLLLNPSRVVPELFKDNPTAIRLLRQSLVEPISGRPSAEGKVLWNQLRQAWLGDIVEKSIKEGAADPKTFNRLMKKLSPQAFREMFPEKEMAANVKRVQTLFEVAGKAPPSGTSLFTRTGQVAGMAMMYNSGKEGDFIGFTTGSLLALGPVAFAKLAMNPKGVKFLTAGFKMKPGASGLVPNAVRMIRLLRNINKAENRAPRRKERENILTRGYGARGF